MNLVKCNNGHYYDGDKFSTCPHCQGSSGQSGSSNTEKTVPMDQTIGPVAITEPITMPGTETIKSEEPKAPSVKTVSGEKTISYYSGVMSAEPVVGWLVCTEGKDFGKSFSLKSGKNFAGRSYDVNDVVIASDTAVSREKHAIIIYDPKSRRFLAQPGMSSELFYVNEEVVLQGTALETGNVIQIGNTKLIFVPLCGPDFSWDDYRKDKE